VIACDQNDKLVELHSTVGVIGQGVLSACLGDLRRTFGVFSF
jgi:hypothetical protein